MDPGWYLRRLSRMGPREIMGRALTASRKRRWRGIAEAPGEPNWLPQREFTAVPPEGVMAAGPAHAAARLLPAAGRALGQRDRAGHPFAVLDLGAPAARHLAGGAGALREQSRGTAADLAPPALARRDGQPRFLGQQPCHRRGRGAARGRVRVP